MIYSLPIFTYRSPAPLRIILPFPMTTRAKIITTVLLLAGLSAAGAADYYLAGREYAADLLADSQDTAAMSGGVLKAEGPDVVTTLQGMNYTIHESEDLTFLAQVSRDAPVRTLVVLQNGDRIGSISWIDGDAKQAFIDLKQALLSAFSARVENLSDRTLQEAGMPVRNILSFRDPALSEETLTFVRVRERLYEFHSAAGSEEAMQAAIEALTSK